jgi:hypothetical protein
LSRFFIKDEACSSRYPHRIVESFKDFENGVLNSNQQFLHLEYTPEDMRRASALAAVVVEKDSALAAYNEKVVKANALLTERHARLAEQEAQLAERDSRLEKQDALLIGHLNRVSAMQSLVAAKDIAIADGRKQLSRMEALLGGARRPACGKWQAAPSNQLALRASVGS